jgi:hypothetical protein
MKSVPCQRRQRIVIRDKNGIKGELYRCSNGVTKHYKKNLTLSVCKSCVLRQPFLRAKAACKELPPVAATWSEPYYEVDGEIVYPFQGSNQKPPVPQGYRRKFEDGEESWQFVSEWGKCPYRQLMNRRTPRGDIQINAFCTVHRSRATTHEECVACLSDMAKIGGDLNKEAVQDNVPLPEPIEERLGEEVPNYPGATELLENYWKAVRRWIAAGRPTRTDIEVTQIHKDFCSRCNWYDTKAKRCKGCGCKVKPKGIAILNKIKMKTEHCPRAFW